MAKTIDDLYFDYIAYLEDREECIAKIYSLDKYKVLVVCTPDNDINLHSWEYATYKEILQNKTIFEKLLNEKYYDIEEELEMQRVILEREQYIRSKIEEFEAYCEDIEKYGY